MAVVFWISLLLLLYTFVIYPAFVVCVGLTSRAEPVEDADRASLPTLAVVVAVCNEHEHLERRVLDLLTCDYSADKLEVIVVTDDGSVDGTIAIAERLQADGLIRHVHCPQRGKNLCMDAAVAKTCAEILVFKDATGQFDCHALIRLARHFSRPEIGVVSGVVVFEDNGHLGALEASYWKFELLMRLGNQRLGYLPSAAGGIHAMRRSIYAPVDNAITRDMIDPVQAVAAGYRAITDATAICYEVPWRGARNVYSNRVRVTKRAWAAVRYNAIQLWRSRKYTPLLQLLSHKVLRFLVWIPLVGLLISSLGLAGKQPIYAMLAAGQLSVYAACGLTLVLARYRIYLPGLSLLAFLLLNLAAMAEGTIRYAWGGRVVGWK